MAGEARHGLSPSTRPHPPAPVAVVYILVRRVDEGRRRGRVDGAHAVVLARGCRRFTEVPGGAPGRAQVEGQALGRIGNVDPVRPHPEDLVCNRLEQLDNSVDQTGRPVGDDESAVGLRADVERLGVVVAVLPCVTQRLCDLWIVAEARGGSRKREQDDAAVDVGPARDGEGAAGHLPNGFLHVGRRAPGQHLVVPIEDLPVRYRRARLGRVPIPTDARSGVVVQHDAWRHEAGSGVMHDERSDGCGRTVSAAVPAITPAAAAAEAGEDHQGETTEPGSHGSHGSLAGATRDAGRTGRVADSSRRRGRPVRALPSSAWCFVPTS